VEELLVREARGNLEPDERRLLTAAQLWREANPMLGTRGCRLGIIKPGLYRMQAKAIAEAAVARVRAGGDPRVEIMIPLIVTEEELALLNTWVREVVDEVLDEAKLAAIDYIVGTMVETPRAALVAGEIADVAEFFSFGTNDLTQMTFGFSRDDVEGRFMSEYLEHKLLSANPFETLDQEGVGQLVELGVERGRTTRPSIKLGICGEHGGDPASVEFCDRIGLDYVSCSPYRVPIARLAAAHAVLGADGPGSTA
jgi:pyruvate,orthophosphate dikinase